MSGLSQKIVVFAPIVFLGCASTAWAQSTSLTFSTLPSAQGWQYHGNDPESSVFSVANNTLQQRTVGKGGTAAWYEIDNFADWSKPFTMEMHARVLSQDDGTDGGLCMDVFDTTKYVAVSVSSYVSDSLTHDYVLSGDFATNTFHFTIDGSSIPVSDIVSSGPNRIVFGDGTPTGSNANVDITQLSFSQDASTPEPGSIALLTACTLGISLFSRRRTKSRVASAGS